MCKKCLNFWTGVILLAAIMLAYNINFRNG